MIGAAIVVLGVLVLIGLCAHILDTLSDNED